MVEVRSAIALLIRTHEMKDCGVLIPARDS